MMFVLYLESLVVLSYVSIATLNSRFSLAASLYSSSLYSVNYERAFTLERLRTVEDHLHHLHHHHQPWIRVLAPQLRETSPLQQDLSAVAS